MTFWWSNENLTQTKCDCLCVHTWPTFVDINANTSWLVHLESTLTIAPGTRNRFYRIWFGILHWGMEKQHTHKNFPCLPVAPIFVDASSVCSANGWVEGALVVIGASVSVKATGTGHKHLLLTFFIRHFLGKRNAIPEGVLYKKRLSKSRKCYLDHTWQALTRWTRSYKRIRNCRPSWCKRHFYQEKNDHNIVLIWMWKLKYREY